MSEGQGHAERRQDDIRLLGDDRKVLQELQTKPLYDASDRPPFFCAEQLAPTDGSRLCILFIADRNLGICRSWSGLLLTTGPRSVFATIKSSSRQRGTYSQSWTAETKQQQEMMKFHFQCSRDAQSARWNKQTALHEIITPSF